MRRLVLCSLATLAACASSDERGGAAQPAPIAPRAGQVVARVDGRPIFARDVRAQMALSKQNKRAALEALIRLELLAGEAARRGLRAAPEVNDQRRRQLATTLIREAFGKNLGPEQIPRKLVARAYRLNKLAYKRPEVVRVKHVLCSPTVNKTPATLAAAKRCIEAAQALVKQAGGKMTPAEFETLDDKVRPSAAPAKVRVETLRTPKRGFTVAEFADAAFELKKPGDISEPVESSFGWHIIYLLERQPARNLSLAQAEAEIRKKIFPEASRILFDRWAKKIERRHGAKTDPKALLRSLAPTTATARRR